MKYADKIRSMTNDELVKFIIEQRIEAYPDRVSIYRPDIEAIVNAEWLKPCPFCGNTNIKVMNENEVDEHDDVYPPYAYTVICPMNSDGCGSASGYRMKKEDAITCWNERT